VGVPAKDDREKVTSSPANLNKWIANSLRAQEEREHRLDVVLGNNKISRESRNHFKKLWGDMQ